MRALNVGTDSEDAAVAQLYAAEDGTSGEDMPAGEVIDVSASKIDRTLEPYVELLED